jgi:Glycosyl hydrolases family 39
MVKSIIKCAAIFIILIIGPLGASPSPGQPVKLVERLPDPHGSPRPARDARDVPLRTSLYFELGMPPKAKVQEVNPDSVVVRLEPKGGDAVELLRPGQHFVEGGSGWLRPKNDLSGVKSLAVYIEPPSSLKPATSYSVHVSAGPKDEAGRSPNSMTWSFTTEAASSVQALEFPLDLGTVPVRWHGHFVSGLCNVIFCTQAANYGPTYELMADARKRHPRAWRYQRDFWPTGTAFRPDSFLPVMLPNIVRERETRRIAEMKMRESVVVLSVEDVFGHNQYSIPAGRAVSEDYHPGDEVLIADGVHDARTKVLAADGAAGTVTVAPFANPPGGWKIAYEGPLPDREDPDGPGLFPPGGCYLRKYAPHGTPCYYWGRLDKEWDLAHRQYGRRLMVNFGDATGDLARDGRSWTTVKDYLQWHEVARTIAGHVIDRYGDGALSFTWSIFNEPDLGPLFWRADWNELQKFYDYTTDAILRAFEDRGYDSKKVFIGGLELGGIFGTNLRLREFLAHCSPRAQAEGRPTAVGHGGDAPLNAAVADGQLIGKRSRRVEALCRDHGGKGSPCDFISIHSYNRSEMMAAKLIRAKEVALEIDPDYYQALWVSSHESCPDWMPPPDEAAADAYLGNGYFPSWCADVVHRQLLQAARDPRYAYGETILTVWPPPANFAGLNAVTRVIHCDDDGDGRGDRTVTIPMPIFHALGMLSDLGDRYWVLPGQVVHGNVLGGFASRDDRGVIRILLYAHHAQDTQSRSEASFDVTLDLDGLGWPGPAHVEEYRFDRDHNSPFRLIRTLRDRPAAGGPPDPARLAEVTKALEGSDPAAQRAALETLRKLNPATRQSAATVVFKLAGQAKDPGVREAAMGIIRGALGPVAYPRAVVEEIREKSMLHPTGTSSCPLQPNGRLKLTVRMAANGCNFLVIRGEAHR